jgi:hypothetical protein
MPRQTDNTKKEQFSPQWQPSSRLPLLITLIDGMLEIANEEYQNLQLACQLPHVLDNDTIERVITGFTSKQKDLGLYDEMMEHWRAETLTDQQRGDLEHLARHLQHLHLVIATVLTLADELKASIHREGPGEKR